MEDAAHQGEELALGEQKLKIVSLVIVCNPDHLHFSRSRLFMPSDLFFIVLITSQLPGASENAVSFQIEKEDHTLGNALRYFINKK